MSLAQLPTPRLPRIDLSPTTLQYRISRPNPRKKALYIRKFVPNKLAKETLSQPWLSTTNPLMPPYPYGRNVTFPEANHGLYGGLSIQSGNKIAKGRNKGKTVRKWYPNIRVEQLKSEALGVVLSLPTAARVMRTIRKVGGLDEYVLGEKPARVKELGLLGWKLRWLVLNSEGMKARMDKERKSLGLDSIEKVAAMGQKRGVDLLSQGSFADAWKDEQLRKEIVDELQAGWDRAIEKERVARTRIIRQASKVGKAHVNRLEILGLAGPDGLPLPEDIEEEVGRRPRPVQRGFGVTELVARDGRKVVGQGNVIGRGRKVGGKEARDGIHSSNKETVARKKKEVLERGEQSTSGVVGSASASASASDVDQ